MESSYKELLQNEYLRRRSLQITYTLKQYSKELGLNYVQLQQILQSEKGLSKSNALRVGRAMGLSHTQAIVFRYMVSAESGRSKAERTLARQKLRNLRTKIKSNQ